MQDTVVVPGSVLSVDSDPAVARRVAELLPACEMVSAGNGYQALREFNARTFDLYLLDYWLPDWCGVQLCREIRKVDPKAPVFFCTNAARDEDRKRALRAGASAYLLKPLDPPKFTRHARIALELANLESTRARVEEERAIGNELHRLTELAKERTVNARAMVAQSMQRTARAKALKVFIEAGGTRANFERWWPQVYDTVTASGRGLRAH